MFLLLTSMALAAPVGEAVPSTDSGPLEALVRGDVEAVEVTDTLCPHDGDCSAVWRTSGVTLEGRIAVIQGVGVYGEVGWGSQRVREADYRGSGLRYAGGLRAAIPVLDRGWWLAGNGRFGWGGGEGSTLDVGGRESASWRSGTISVLAAWREPGGGVSTWLGGQGTWLWGLHVLPLGKGDGDPRLDLDLVPTRPLSWVGGAALTSEPLGSGFRRSARVSVAFEGHLGQSMGASASFGVAY